MKALFLLSGIFFLSIAVHAQNGKGTVAGKVKDKHGQPIPYTTVSLKGFQSGAVTNEQGNFIFRAAPGNYRLVATSVGYTAIDTTLKITENATVQMNITLPDNNSQLKEVEVSGVKLKSAASTRTLTQIQDIPQAVVVIGQKVIKQQAAFDLTTVTRNISGVNFNGNYSGAGSYQFFSARGFDLSGSQNYRWNGMMIWNLGNNYADNIEQVEFLKGPASILYGDVAPGGVMNFVTKKPLSEFTARAEFKTGSWGLVRPSIDITGPIDEKQHLRFRVNASYEQSNSFRDFVKSDKSFLAPSIAWDITPKLSVVAEVVLNKTRSTDDAGLVSPDGTIKGLSLLKPSLYLGDPTRKYLFNETNYFTTINYELSKTWRFKVTGFYGVTGNRPNGLWFDQPDSMGNFVRESYSYYQRLKNGTVTADLSGTFFTGSIKHNILFGVDYQSTHYRYTSEGALTPFDTMNIFHPVYGQTVSPPVPERPFLPYVALIERTGIFAQDQLMFFNNKLHVLVGLRAGRTRQGNHYFQDQLAGTGYEGSTDNIISKNVWTPRLGVVYKPKEWLSLYGSYSKGYEVNSPDLFALNYKEFAVPPPTISDQIEFGAKGNLNDKLGISLSLYTINKHDPYGYVYENPENPDYDRYNIYYKGHHQSMGIEMDVDGKLFPFLSITAGASLNQAKVIWDPGYPKGNELPNAPKFMGNLWLNYEPLSVIKGFTAGAGIFYKGKFFTSLANDPTLQIPGSYTLDLSAGYKYKSFDLQVNAMNITNRVNYLNPWAFNLFDVRPLRQYVVTLSYQFKKSNTHSKAK